VCSKRRTILLKRKILFILPFYYSPFISTFRKNKMGCLVLWCSIVSAHVTSLHWIFSSFFSFSFTGFLLALLFPFLWTNCSHSIRGNSSSNFNFASVVLASINKDKYNTNELIWSISSVWVRGVSKPCCPL